MYHVYVCNLVTADVSGTMHVADVGLILHTPFTPLRRAITHYN